MERLFIAEKPSLAKAIAENLGNPRRQQTHFTCNNADVVTWCFGHMLELYDPEDYSATWRAWTRTTLPMIPKLWKTKPREKVQAQVRAIGQLLKQARCVVNAGDPDREGQLIVDELLECLGYTGKVQRIWLASLDARSVRHALDTLRDNEEYTNLRDAARARSQADWLIGMNGTRAMTIVGRESGRNQVLSIGRVQTPTLSLVVNRDRAIAAFKPIDYLVLQAALQHSNGDFTAAFKPVETQVGLDSEGRLVDEAVAQQLTAAVQGSEGIIASVSREKKTQAAPLPHCLSSLQKAASAKFGMTAQQVLDTAQSLYEKKLTTYPRSDCRYLPEEQFKDAGRILSALSLVPELDRVTSKATPEHEGAVWNTKKITAHHAIIPTGEAPQTLSNDERKLFLMIATGYILQFYPVMKYEAQKIVVHLGESVWESRGRCILEAGWTQYANDESPSTKEQALPLVNNGDKVLCTHVENLRKKTSPPARFTEGTLIEAMANVHRFVSDAAAKTTLKENEGIGTEATRAGILETLKKRGFLKVDGKALLSTPLGQELIDRVPESFSNPVTTAHWEQRLEGIARGKTSLESFMEEQIAVLPAMLEPVLSASVKLADDAIPCPECGKALSRQKSAKDGSFYWACFNREAHAGKPLFFPDAAGKPIIQPTIVTSFTCPDCKKPLLRKSGVSKAGKPYEMFKCSECRAAFWEQDGKPNFNKRVNA